jgi:hypothetical protein
MEDKIDLTDIIIAGLRRDPKVTIEAIKSSINKDKNGSDFDNIFCSLLRKVFAKDITPDLAIKLIGMYAQIASIVGHPKAFYKADVAYMWLTNQKYKEKGALR